MHQCQLLQPRKAATPAKALIGTSGCKVTSRLEIMAAIQMDLVASAE